MGRQNLRRATPLSKPKIKADTQKKIDILEKKPNQSVESISENYMDDDMADPKKPKIPPLAKPTVQIPKNVEPKREFWIEHMVKKLDLRYGCELGVWKGRTFLHLLKTCPDLFLIGVDLWAPQPDNDGPENYLDWPHEENERKVRQEAARFGKRAKIYKMWTRDSRHLIQNESLDFVFIDADHSTESVRQDLEWYLPKLKPNGWIIGHDINWPTVKVVADNDVPGYYVGPDNLWFRNKNPEIKW